MHDGGWPGKTVPPAASPPRPSAPSLTHLGQPMQTMESQPNTRKCGWVASSQGCMNKGDAGRSLAACTEASHDGQHSLLTGLPTATADAARPPKVQSKAWQTNLHSGPAMRLRLGGGGDGGGRLCVVAVSNHPH